MGRERFLSQVEELLGQTVDDIIEHGSNIISYDTLSSIRMFDEIFDLKDRIERIEGAKIHFNADNFGDNYQMLLQRAMEIEELCGRNIKDINTSYEVDWARECIAKTKGKLQQTLTDLTGLDDKYYSYNELKEKQEELERVWKMPLEDIENTCERFMGMLAEAEVGYFRNKMHIRAVTKENIKKFFDGATEKIFADSSMEFGDSKYGAYEFTDDAHFDDYYWEEILKQPNVGEIIDYFAFRFYAEYSAPTLCCGIEGLYIGDNNGYEKDDVPGFDWEHLRRDFDLNAPEDIIKSVETGTFTKSITDKPLYFLKDGVCKSKNGLEK
jgi:hypothetical protein